MKISITGASGHIGNNLCRQLIGQGHQVKALIHQSDRSLSGLDVEKIRGDILDVQAVDELIGGADYVYHTAAVISIGAGSKEHIFQTNVDGTRLVIAACQKHKIKRLIHFSSIHALKSGSPDALLDESAPLAGQESYFYNQSKARTEALLLDACRQGLNVLILNPSSVVGPDDFAPSLAGQMIIELANGKLPFLIRGGYHWVDVRDVVQAAVNAMSLGQNGHRYLLTSQWMSLLTIAEIIGRQANRRTPVIVPGFLARAGLPFVHLFSRLSGTRALYTSESLDIVSHSPRQVSNQKAVAELQFNPRPVAESFTDALHWFDEQGYLKKSST
jgi:dihydroflavonol-4-reductase